MGDPGAEGVPVDAEGGRGLLGPRVVVEPGPQRVFERGAVGGVVFPERSEPRLRDEPGLIRRQRREQAGSDRVGVPDGAARARLSESDERLGVRAGEGVVPSGAETPTRALKREAASSRRASSAADTQMTTPSSESARKAGVPCSTRRRSHQSRRGSAGASPVTATTTGAGGRLPRTRRARPGSSPRSERSSCVCSRRRPRASCSLCSRASPAIAMTEVTTALASWSRASAATARTPRRCPPRPTVKSMKVCASRVRDCPASSPRSRISWTRIPSPSRTVPERASRGGRRSGRPPRRTCPPRRRVDGRVR